MSTAAATSGRTIGSDDQVRRVRVTALPRSVNVVGAAQPARSEQHDEEQRRRREADDDRRQHERLRHRIGVVLEIRPGRRA